MSSRSAHLPRVAILTLIATSVEVGSWDDHTWIQGAAALVLAAPFDTTGVAGEEGNRVRSRVLAADREES